MIKISVKKIKKAVKELCKKTATTLDKKTYNLILKAYKKETNIDSKEILSQILKNAEIANKKQRPLCQDTGQVIIFLEIGQDVIFTDGELETAINEGVAESYKENFLRKSVAQNAIIRENTGDNTPAIIHTKIVPGSQVKLILGLKGGGAENMSTLKMLSPSAGEEGIIAFILETIKNAATKACPPLILGIGIGGNFETCAINAKKALFIQKQEKTTFEKKLLDKLNDLNIGASGNGGETTVLDLNIIEAPCHIASMPVAINLNCHSSRHSEAIIDKNVMYNFDKFDYEYLEIEDTKTDKEVFTKDTDAIKNLKTGEKILLTGEVFTARDEAHKRILASKEKPFNIKNSIVFYAGPCPSKPNEKIGPIGPTTSIRMDKYIDDLLKLGLIGTIGKGERSQECINSLQKNNAVYLTATGGVASLLAKCVKNSEIVAYEELGPEAIYKLEVEKLPLYVACGKIEE